MNKGEVRFYNSGEFDYVHGRVRFIKTHDIQIHLIDLSESGWRMVERYHLISPSVLGAWNDDSRD